MLVLKSTYETLCAKYSVVCGLLRKSNDDYNKLRKEWNALVDKLNALGGEAFLLRGSLESDKNQFSQADILLLIKLCHPDKHHGSKDAEEITKRLLAMRTKTK